MPTSSERYVVDADGNRLGKELADSPAQEYPRVATALRALADDPRPPGCVKLTARDAWRIGVGNYRVLYHIDDGERMVTVVHIGNRRDVYR